MFGSVLESRVAFLQHCKYKQVKTRSTPASRRDAPKIGRRSSAGYLRYAMGPVPKGRDEQTGHDDWAGVFSRKKPTYAFLKLLSL